MARTLLLVVALMLLRIRKMPKSNSNSSKEKNSYTNSKTKIKTSATRRSSKKPRTKQSEKELPSSTSTVIAKVSRKFAKPPMQTSNHSHKCCSVNQSKDEDTVIITDDEDNVRTDDVPIDEENPRLHTRKDRLKSCCLNLISEDELSQSDEEELRVTTKRPRKQETFWNCRRTQKHNRCCDGILCNNHDVPAYPYQYSMGISDTISFLLYGITDRIVLLFSFYLRKFLREYLRLW